MTLRKTRPGDLPAIQELYDAARTALKAQGVDQWQDGPYPSAQDARRDIEAGVSYVLEENGRVLATACVAFGREPNYERIVEGNWAADPAEYGFLHRIAVAPEAKGKGAAGLLFDELKRQAAQRGVSVIRGDTHRDNLPMRRAMAKAGLACRGVIYVEDGSPRLAYEAVLDPVTLPNPPPG